MTVLNGFKPRSPSVLWRAFTNLSGNLYALIVRIPWVIAIVVIGMFLFRGLTQHTTVIKDIAMPKTLTERGYTSDVAGYRLRDALYDLKEQARTEMRAPEIALAGDLPTIVVPTVGISLDAVVSSLRTLLRSTRSRTITGEVTVNKDDSLWLVLRVDGKKFHQSEVGIAQDKPDDLFTAAAVDVMKIVKPYLVVASMAEEKPEAALTMAQEMISQLPPGSEEFPWLYNLQASIYMGNQGLLDDGVYTKAFNAVKLALDANKNFAIARANHGAILERVGRLEEALAELQLAITLDSTMEMTHAFVGNVFTKQGDFDKAIDAYKRAIDINPRSAPAHDNLGTSLRKQRKFDEAIDAYKRAIDINPKYAIAYNNLGAVYADQRKFDEAIAAYKKAIDIKPKYALAHANLGMAYVAQRKFDEATAAYKKATDIEPNSWARDKLKELLSRKS